MHAQREGLAVHGCTCKFNGSLVIDLQCSFNNMLCSFFNAVLLVRYSAPAMSARVVQPCTAKQAEDETAVSVGLAGSLHDAFITPALLECPPVQHRFYTTWPW